MLDRDIHRCRALVIDGNPTSRSILVAQLRDFGVGSVVQCGRIAEARTLLEHRSFDLVLCEHDFPGSDFTGQQLLDDLRRHQLLPLSTVFVMITAEAAYTRVAEAAESALDGYLLKPHTATALAERLGNARRRKRILNATFELIDQGRFEAASELCIERFRSRSDYWLFSARIGAELLLNLGRHAEARELFDAIVATQALPWARLGLARAHLDGGEPAQALRTLESLVTDEPGYADAYDVMGRVQVEQGRLVEAMEVFRQAAQLTPGSVGRQQKLGMLAYYSGLRVEAARALERAVTAGMNSKMFDAQTLVLLAFLRHVEKDSKGLQRCADELAHLASRTAPGRRIERFAEVVDVLVRLLHRQVGEVVQRITRLAAELRDEAFDFEAACNMVSLLSLLTAAEVSLDRAGDWVDAIALRYCSSKALAELLARSAAVHTPFVERVRAAQQRVAAISEHALARGLAGDPAAGVRLLLAEGSSTLNAKLIEMAQLVLQRHRERIDDAEKLQAGADALRERYAAQGARLPLGEAGTRKVGALALRVDVDRVAADSAR
jgi:CheY-like chemotaxis protein